MSESLYLAFLILLFMMVARMTYLESRHNGSGASIEKLQVEIDKQLRKGQKK